MISDRQILELMLKTPDIRAVQISDALDEEPVYVSRALRDLVECGTIVQQKGIAPNGVSALQYNLSDDFKESREYAALVAIAQPAAAAPAPIQVPTFVPITPAPKGPSRIDLAIAYITEQGSATDEQLRKVMGLVRTEFPSSVLASAVRGKRIVKGPEGWVLVGKQPASKPKAFQVTSNSKHGPVAQFSPTAQPEELQAEEVIGLPAELVEQLSKPAQALVEDEPESLVKIEPVDRRAEPRTFRIAMWSDGALELQRDGGTIASLTRDECDQLAGFLQRMAVAA